MITLDLACLRSLIAVASFAGVGRAAEALHLSQPAVSGHLRRLESELGFPIVAKQGRAIAFTAQGEDVLREAHRLVREHDAAVAGLTGAGAADVTVASTEHASEPMLRSVGRVLRRAFPQHSVRYEFHRSARVREFVHDHTADVAIGFGDLGRGSQRVVDVLLAWVGPARAPSYAERLVTFAPPCMIRERILSSPMRELPVGRECIDLTSLVSAVRDGVGITALPRTGTADEGLRFLDDLPELPPVQLATVMGPRISAAVGNEIRDELRRTWAES